jgi:glycosyltransferase involved in cell wall biosynthesis
LFQPLSNENDRVTHSVTVVIPVCNGASTLPACLEALSCSTHPAAECIVVDDGSTDDSAGIARRAGAKVIELAERGGPARARNLGACAASNDTLLFIDADVCVHEDTIERAMRALDQDNSLDALIGSYDFEPAERNFLSQYKNLFHSFVHHHGRSQASTFWTGCGAIRRESFLEAGGFPEHWDRPSVEDIAFGAAIRRSGGRIRLDPALEVTHLKRWSLWSLLRTDIFDRAIPWTLLMLRDRAMPNDLNLRMVQRLCVLLVCLAPLAALRFPSLAFLAVALAMVLNHELYGFLATRRGWWFAIRAVPLHLLYFLYSGAAMAAAVAWFALRPEPVRPKIGLDVRTPPV